MQMSPAHEHQPISSAPMPLSPIMTEAAFDNYLPPNQLPPPPPPPPPTQQPRTLLRDRGGVRHPPRIPRLRRLSPPDTDNMRFRCLSDDRVVDMDRLCGEKTNIPGQNQSVLEFDVMEQDGGQYSASYGVSNMLRNDNSVFCSARSGTINILLRYRGKRKTDQSCVISQIVIKAPQYGFTAPCKDGMVFVSRYPIDVERTRIFDDFTASDYEHYMANKPDDDLDPVGWFSLDNERHVVIPVEHRSAKYVLVKLIRSELEVDNIDIQYLGFVGYSGARSFANARIC